VYRVTQDTTRLARVFGYGTVTLFGRAFQRVPLTFAMPHRGPTTPAG
jgi:hypothetical protein